MLIKKVGEENLPTLSPTPGTPITLDHDSFPLCLSLLYPSLSVWLGIAVNKYLAEQRRLQHKCYG